MNADSDSAPALPEPPLPPMLTTATAPRKPWGFWKVLGGVVLALLVSSVVPVVLTVVYLAITEGAGFRPTPERLGASQFGLAGWIGTLGALALCWSMARRIGDGRPGAVLGVERVTFPTLLKWCGAAVVLCTAGDGLLLLLGRPIVHESMLEMYGMADSKLLLLLVVNVQAPMMEEVMMRGFFLEGLRHTKVGTRGAVALSALLWAGLHIQYDLVGIGTLLVVGLVLGVARLRTGSILPTIAMHAVNNVWSTVELLYVVHHG
jgi:membrane protease YdiL (CAAX protease family)